MTKEMKKIVLSVIVALIAIDNQESYNYIIVW